MKSSTPSQQTVLEFLEHTRLPSKISGSFFDREGSEMPVIGITGWGIEYPDGEKKNAWIHGELLSGTYVDNGACACRSHIEGIVTDTGELRILEQVYDFIAHEGNCFEYDLAITDMNKFPLRYEGNVIARMNRNDFVPVEAGKAFLEINPFWHDEKMNQARVSRNHSSRYNDRLTHISGSYIPQFWKEFLGQIEAKGYQHPYSTKK